MGLPLIGIYSQGGDIPLTLRIDTRVPAGDHPFQIKGEGIWVDWGDGTITSPGDYHTHTFPNNIANGLVKVYGNSSYIRMGHTSIKEVETWGTFDVANFQFGNRIDFLGFSSSLATVPAQIPKTITSMDSMFYGCKALVTDISTFDTSRVTSFKEALNGCSALEAELADWDVSKVTTMEGMCVGANKLDPDLTLWQTISLTNLNTAFSNMAVFTGRGLQNWDVSKVTDFLGTFKYGLKFNGNVASWNTNQATVLYETFRGCPMFNRNVQGWSVSSIVDPINFGGFLRDCTSYNQDLSGMCVSNIPAEPANFAAGATAWVLPKPIWGTCP